MSLKRKLLKQTKKRGGGLVGVSELARYAENPASLFERPGANRSAKAYGTKAHRDVGQSSSPVGLIVVIIVIAAAAYYLLRGTHG